MKNFIANIVGMVAFMFIVFCILFITPFLSWGFMSDIPVGIGLFIGLPLAVVVGVKVSRSISGKNKKRTNIIA